ncbi:MAG: gamma-glutamyl-gamma-aminobutyrate hydrolase family protein [Thermotogae bacterium]|nr:gamma-glutamyl-gamma-aminobutyrate hydrolase family protein [Thermotogota bacterium]
MRILVTAGKREKAKNYIRYFSALGEVDVVTPDDAHLPHFDVLVLAGGEDVHPRFYGEEIAYPDLLEINESRDRMELTLVGRAIKEGKAIFGICRGFQLLTVFGGGKLYQDLDRAGFKGELHKTKDGDAFHGVKFYEDFSKIFSDSGEVNSAHHQGLKESPKNLLNLRVLAIAEDGLVEAFVSKPLRILAVQWHPERHGSSISQGLLNYFAETFLKV